MASAVKEKFVEEFSEELKKIDHIVVTEYKGLNAEEFTELRNKLRSVGAKYKVVKNRLAKIAVKNADRKIENLLKGPSGLAYEGTDVAALTKTLFEFSKAHTNLVIKGGYLFGESVDSNAVKSIANLPSREVLLATLLATMNAPLQKLVATMNEPIRSLHAAISAVAKKKESAPAA